MSASNRDLPYSGIVISSYYHLDSVTKGPELAAAVSILGRTDRLAWPSFGGRPTLRLSFDDTYSNTDWASAPIPEHIRQLIEFCRAWSGRGILLVHCRAGSARSVAAAMIAAHAIGRSDLLSAIATARAYFRPNRRMLEMADEALGGTKLLSTANSVSATDRTTPWKPVLIPIEN